MKATEEDKIKEDTINHLNFLLKEEKLPLKIRLLSKYFFHLQIQKDVVLCIFLTCKMLEHRLSLEFLNKYDNSPFEYKKREEEFLFSLNFRLDFSLSFIDLYISLFKLFEEDFKVFYSRTVDLELGGFLRIQLNDFLKLKDKDLEASGENQKASGENQKALENYKMALFSAPEKGNFLLNIFQFLQTKQNMLLRDDLSEDLHRLHSLFNKSFMESSSGLFSGFTGRELEINKRNDPQKRLIEFLQLVENLHERTEIVREFYESSDFLIYLFFNFLDKRELEMFQLIFDFQINDFKLNSFKKQIYCLFSEGGKIK